MIIKKYVVDEMHQAVQKIKEDLGADAIIVSSQKVPGQGIMGFFKKRLEVTAVLDDSKDALPREPKRLKEPEQAEIPEAATSPVRPEQDRPDQGAAGDAGSSPPRDFKPLFKAEILNNLEQQEKERLLAMLEQQLEQKDKVGSKDFTQRWLTALTGIDIDHGIAKKLLAGLEQSLKDGVGDKDDLTKMALIGKATQLLKPAYKGIGDAKYLAFIGPPGVGKTTTLAKLATGFKLMEGKKVALITVYTYRYGANDYLKVIGSTIDAPVEVVMTPAELRQAVEKHADKDYILIDTVGRSSKRTGQVLELKGFLEALNGPKNIFLVMSASTKNRDLYRIAKDFQIAQYNGFIFTKVDETETLGSLLNLVSKTGIPVQYYTDGQSIPDDIKQVQPKMLAQLILRSVDEQYEELNL
ncbi:flagellar biosynthesis protein FlhF [Desulfofalx alkaliphila]|uniref:flagellar biosynthesis protein FlhF n=1 Tax=Desulfofalx alkaliphila TaxID=105483 RepID=UPI0004E27FC8|nr:flagellar biosynthesis protein FlhF [Desulfofalx alkaliphila]